MNENNVPFGFGLFQFVAVQRVTERIGHNPRCKWPHAAVVQRK
jgi:hypothetical protein